MWQPYFLLICSVIVSLWHVETCLHLWALRQKKGSRHAEMRKIDIPLSRLLLPVRHLLSHYERKKQTHEPEMERLLLMTLELGDSRTS